MPFRWRAILLAPLVTPAVIAAWMATDVAKGQSALGMFAIFFALGSIVSYGVTVFMLLPTLFVVSRFARLTALRMAALGALLGLVAYLPLTLMMYFSPSMDSPAAEDSYWKFMSADCGVPLLMCCGAGLVTAVAYWFLARPGAEPKPEVQS